MLAHKDMSIFAHMFRSAPAGCRVSSEQRLFRSPRSKDSSFRNTQKYAAHSR